MNLFSALLAFCFPLVASAADAFDPAALHFLPVHHDPQHAEEVERRLEAEPPRYGLPARHEIPRSFLSPVLHQGTRGTCSFFATLGIVESHYLAQSPAYNGLALSVECLADVRDWMFDQGDKYTGADRPRQRPDPNGDYPSAILQTIEAHGVPVARAYGGGVDCRYDGANTGGSDLSLRAYLSTLAAGRASSAAYGKGLGFAYDHAPTLAAIKASLARNVPVEVALLVFDENLTRSEWSYDPAADGDDKVRGSHAVILTGYDTSGGGTRFTFKNSWGTDWGQAGYGTLDAALLTHGWGYDPDVDFALTVRP